MDWDEYYFNLIEAILQKSKDPHTKVGCLVVGPDHEIRTTGYNSFVRGLDDNVPERHERPEKYKWIEHAERNAFYNAARVGTPLLGCTLYVIWIPCIDCARGVVQCGIKNVVVDDRDTNPWRSRTDWNMSDSLKMFEECGIDVRYWRP